MAWRASSCRLGRASGRPAPDGREGGEPQPGPEISLSGMGVTGVKKLELELRFKLCLLEDERNASDNTRIGGTGRKAFTINKYIYIQYVAIYTYIYICVLHINNICTCVISPLRAIPAPI